ncbi:MAG TPA: ABC transporter transmembrane domain-containing protein, partial [bacterium]|nr:ABC transporter transmembrane domain-containing protein [bacterium]
MDSGLKCLLIMATYHGIPADEAMLRHEFGNEPFSARTILLAAEKVGMHGKLVAQPLERLEKAPFPAIAVDKAGNFFIAVKYDPGSGEGPRLLVQQPDGPPRVLKLAEFVEQWSGSLIFITSKANFAGDVANFDFSWFIPAIVKHRKILGEVMLVSFVLQLIGLATPLFFQVVMDKVLVNHAMKTLDVIAVGLTVATLFGALLTGIRTYVTSHTSSKIDVELGARLFRHLLALPTSYFQARRVGDSVARIR